MSEKLEDLLHQCEKCKAQFAIKYLLPFEGALELQPGEVVPAGCCPTCDHIGVTGARCYPRFKPRTIIVGVEGGVAIAQKTVENTGAPVVNELTILARRCARENGGLA